MNQQQGAAARVLLNLSALADHPHVQACIEPDGWRINWERLDEWRWSSGERILIELLRTIVLGHGEVKVHDIYQLDSDNRAVAGMALANLLGQPSGGEL